ncbi:MAG: type II toxin-antitoxin system prevent-host-death family antitoxin [Nitrospira sp. CG24D]|nr:MAG: type II toxin-antitoxin system prevent-host-death family antitoxin [Nitrospira sp. CG24D]
MGTVNVKETRRQLKTLLDRVEAGETITIARHGAVVAKLVPPAKRPKRLPSLAALRRTIRPKGRSLSNAVLQARTEERA